ncbi:hypothetical protein BCR33DRAFT_849716 [Rhizoclosmatium globosum]|uniref:HMG box domain-containing protein n=1 Tax=Rhizoclosmatium globosum TaxID=329046 RepID=A0A1Y2CGE7_9FUNG|nr:hypothetical protein BCR33DRAFT_849716 [Rhizoclosmatium globosum]|eukprot:ORY46120.1 hypothetical protein BCR33DRAFT_849716 [Rhizoclosmatium globosum]
MSLTPAMSSPTVEPLHFDNQVDVFESRNQSDQLAESTRVESIQDDESTDFLGSTTGPAFTGHNAQSSSSSSWDIHDSMEDPENTPEEVLQTRRNIARNERRKSARSEKQRQGSAKPQNAFLLYKTDRYPEICAKYNGRLSLAETTKLVASLWRQESLEVKAIYANRSRELRMHFAIKVRKAVAEANARVTESLSPSTSAA